MPQSPTPSDDLKVGGGNKKALIEVPDNAQDAVDLNTEVHAKVLRKLDWHLLPLVSLLYLLSFL